MLQIRAAVEVENDGAEGLTAGAAVSGSPFAGSGTISTPTAVAIDATGNVWIGNLGNNSVTELTSAGSYVQQFTSGVANPQSLAVNPK